MKNIILNSYEDIKDLNSCELKQLSKKTENTELLTQLIEKKNNALKKQIEENELKLNEEKDLAVKLLKNLWGKLDEECKKECAPTFKEIFSEIQK